MTRHCYDYERPQVTADSVVLCTTGGVTQILLIQRKGEPYRGFWALPGGFMDMDETTEQAAHRELQEETGLTGVTLQRVGLFDAVDRDPRGRTLTMAYAGVVMAEDAATVKAGDDASDLAWHDVNALPDLAFDHAAVVDAARRVLKL